MSDTHKHPPKPDRFTRKHRTAAHQARTKRDQASARETKPSPRPCTTCAGSGWLRSGVGHYGEQEGGCKDVLARCSRCMGLGYLEPGEPTP